MAIVIDGYNFLDGANILALGPGRYSLEKSRQAILRVLRANLTEAECATTTVVFDGTQAPPGLPRRDKQFGITILYSQPGQLADDLIEELIGKHSHPRQLTVVSSDHRIQRAARRRQAKPVDSDVWYRGLPGRVGKKPGGKDEPQLATEVPKDVTDWKKEFGDIDLEALEAEAEVESESRRNRLNQSKELPSSNTGPAKQSPRKKAKPAEESPFPQGYGEDVLEEDEKPSNKFNPFPKGYGEDLLDDEA